jgi:hypothetical protein
MRKYGDMEVNQYRSLVFRTDNGLYRLPSGPDQLESLQDDSQAGSPNNLYGKQTIYDSAKKSKPFSYFMHGSTDQDPLK